MKKLKSLSNLFEMIFFSVNVPEHHTYLTIFSFFFNWQLRMFTIHSPLTPNLSCLHMLQTKTVDMSRSRSTLTLLRVHPSQKWIDLGRTLIQWNWSYITKFNKMMKYMYCPHYKMIHVLNYNWVSQSAAPSVISLYLSTCKINHVNLICNIPVIMLTWNLFMTTYDIFMSTCNKIMLTCNLIAYMYMY